MAGQNFQYRKDVGRTSTKVGSLPVLQILACRTWIPVIHFLDLLGIPQRAFLCGNFYEHDILEACGVIIDL